MNQQCIKASRAAIIVIFAFIAILSSTDLCKADISDFDNIVFIHHSVGNNLINRGGIRARIAQYNSQHGTNLEFWDHDRNTSGGLRNENGYPTGMHYGIPNDNTDPDGFYNIFNQPINNPPNNTMSYLMLPHQVGSETINHEVIIFKSCFTAALIYSDQRLQDYENWYLGIRDIMDQHPERLFIAMTMPPRAIDDGNTPEMGARLRAFNEFMAAPAYWSGHPNVFVFNYWSLLVEHNTQSPYFNSLRQIYQGFPVNSHPNELADETIGPIFYQFIIDAIESYSSGDSLDTQSPTVTVNSPNGAEIWDVGTSHNIVWNSFDNIGVVSHRIEYSTNGGGSWLMIRDWIDGDPHTFSWAVPNTPSTQARVRVTCRDESANTGNDISNGNFTIRLVQNQNPNPPSSGFNPSNGEQIASLMPIIGWNHASDPDAGDPYMTLSYIIEIDISTAFTNPVDRDTTLPGHNYQQFSQSLTPNSHYYYRIRTLDDGGLLSGWSPVQHFWTLDNNFPPEPFPLYSPDDSSTQVVLNTVFRWGHTIDNDPGSSLDYTLQISREYAFNQIDLQFENLLDTTIIVATEILRSINPIIYWRVKAIDNAGLERIGGIPIEEVRRLRIIPAGDANSSGVTNGLDAVYLVNFLKGFGPPPVPVLAGDANGNCIVNGLDVTFLINYFKGGPAPIRGDCAID